MKMLENGKMAYIVGSQPLEGYMGEECKGDTKIQAMGQEGKRKMMVVMEGHC